MNKSFPRGLPSYLFVLPWSLEHVGGVNQVVINLAHEMARQKTFEPLVLITDWNTVDPIWEVVQGVQTIRWRVRPFDAGMGIKARIAFAIWERHFRAVFRRFCVEHRVAVVNLHYPSSNAFTFRKLLAGIKLEIPLIISFHGADLSSIAASGRSAISRWKNLLLESRAVVACSKHLADRVVDTFGNDVYPSVVHNGINTVSFLELANAFEPAERRSILSVGKFEEKKGQDVLIVAFSRIADKHPELDLVLLGATDERLSYLRKLCLDNGLEKRVLFFPETPHANVVSFYQRASIFALPSRQEPFGIVILEAGCFGLPVVASRVGGIPEILTDGVTGRLVSPDDPDELAQALASLLDDMETAEAMGERLRKHVLTNFTWTSALAKYVTLSTT